jgi:uncharacterized delta-60 repeat protein
MGARSNARIKLLVATTAVLALLALPAAASATPFDGALDPAFDGSTNGNGIVTSNINSRDDLGGGVVVQSDGKIVVVGTTDVNPSGSTDLAFAAARYNADGTLDTTFDGPFGGGNGFFVLNYNIGANADDILRDVTIDANGKLVAVGETFNATTGKDFAVLRINSSNGALDGTFGSGGVQEVSFTNSTDQAYTVTIDSSQRILVAGDALIGTNSFDFGVARLSGSNGALDTTFDGPSGTGNGTVNIPVNPGTVQDQARDIAVQPDGKIVMAGFTNISGSGNDMALVRLNASDGTLDSGFDGPSGSGDGNFTITFGSGSTSDRAQALLVHGSTGLLVGGIAEGTSYVLLQLNISDGSLDTSFSPGGADGNGISKIDATATGDEINDLALQSDGKIVGAGLANGDFGLVRWTAGGDPDPFFDGPSGTGNGTVITSLSANNDTANALALQSDGKIVAAGTTGPPNLTDIGLARFLVDFTPPDTALSGPASTNNADPLITVAIGAGDTSSSFQCVLDGSPHACSAGPQHFGPFAPNTSHTLTAAAVDQSGNVDPSPATLNFTIDQIAPNGTITGGPSGNTTDRTPSFTFASNEAGSTFQCKIDPPPGLPAGVFGACSSPTQITFNGNPLPDGTYTLNLRTTDAAGNVDPSDAVQTFTVVTPPPPPSSPTPTTSAPPGPTGLRAAALKKCKKKHGAARAKCKKKANLLPI